MANSVFTPEQEQRINDLLVEYLAQNGAAIESGNVHELTGSELATANLRKLTIPSIMADTNQWAYASLGVMIDAIAGGTLESITRQEFDSIFND